MANDEIETEASKLLKPELCEQSAQRSIMEEYMTETSKPVVSAETTANRSLVEKKKGSMPRLEGEYQMDIVGEEIAVRQSVEEFLGKVDIQQYYRPWAAMHILGIEEKDLVRFMFTDRERREDELEYEGIWIDPASGQERGVRGRKRIFGMHQLDTEVLSRAALVNIKPGRSDYVAIDAVRMFDTFGNRMPWGSWESRGLFIENNAKICKRLSTLTRDSFVAARFDNLDVAIEVVGHDDLKEYVDYDSHCDDKMLDGATAISASFYRRMCEFAFAEGGLDPLSEKGRRIWRRLMKSKSGQFRMVNADGLWKGDYIVSEQEHLHTMEGTVPVQIDVRSFYKNCKPEVRWTEGTFIHLEPHPHKTDQIVYTDEQTHSWLLRHMFTPDDLTKTLRDLNEEQFNKLSVGIIPDHIRKWMEVEDEEGEDENELSKKGQISDIQHIIAKWVRAGFNIRNSRHIIMQLGRGHINMLNSPKKGRRFPIPNAVRHHVATNAWLRMAEYLECEVEEGFARYCEEAQRFIFADRDFVKLYARHGGWDLDDTIVAIHAEVERSGRQVWVIYRSPNNIGEYSILNYEADTPRPSWIVDRGNNKITLSKMPEFLEKFVPEYNNLPEPAPKAPSFDIRAIKQHISEAPGARQIGVWANSQMVWLWTNDCPRPTQLIPTEFAADACMQDRDPDRIQLVCDDIELTMQQLKEGEAINRDLWSDRIRRPRNIKQYRYTDKGVRGELHRKFGAAVIEFEKRVAKLASTAGDELLPMLDFTWAPATDTSSKKFRKMYQDALDWRRTHNIDMDHDQWNLLAENMARVLGLNTTSEQIRILLHVAWVKYSAHNSDKILFQFNRDVEVNIIDFYIHALHAACFRNMARNWNARSGS